MRLLRRAVCALGLAGLLASVQPAQAQQGPNGFPNRPITLINVFAPGGPTDIYLRAVANKAKDVFGVPVVIENKPGGGGTVGPAVMAATAKPDGYTISYVGAGMFTVPFMQKVTFDPIKDFTYIISLSGYRILVAVKNDSRWQSWADVAAEAKGAPNKLTYSTPGLGSATHLAFESAAYPLGLKFRHVPFKGASEQVAAMLGGHIDLTAVGGNVFPVIDAGEARPILWLTDDPSPRYPQVPGLKQLGIKSEIDLNFPFGLAGPKGMDPAIVEALHQGFKKVMETPEHAAILEQLDQPNRYMGPAEYTAFAQQQLKAYKVALERLGIAMKQ